MIWVYFHNTFFLSTVFLFIKSNCFFYIQDEYDALSNYSSLGIEFCEKYTQFIKDRASIEQEYASKIK